MKKSFIAQALALAVIVGAFAAPSFAATDDTIDPLTNTETPYIIVTDLDLGGAQGSIDLSKMIKHYPPMTYELRLSNQSANPVNVRIPALDVSYLVPANTERVVYLNASKVGVHNEVDYSVEQIVTPVTQAMDISSIQYILSSSYTDYQIADYYQKEEPVYNKPARSTANVRGYW